jgi:PhzF family phenazine biosynthesis protein
MKFYIVDAFTDTLFGGNPAGVVILPDGADFPSDKIMVKTAAELRYSETAFIKRINEKEFNIRYFTPAAEVDLCGHATIGSFKALLHAGYVEDNSNYINHTLAGDLNIDIKDGFVLMDMASPVNMGQISDEPALKELYEVMGLDYEDQTSKGVNLIPQMISTGLPDIMMPVADRESLKAISPDFPALSALSQRYEVVGVHAFTTDAEEGTTCHVRNFAPLYDIDEEAATGTSNGALTYYGYLNGFIKSGDNCKFLQGEKMDRPSIILSHIQASDDESCNIQVGGSGVILAEGDIKL